MLTIALTALLLALTTAAAFSSPIAGATDTGKANARPAHAQKWQYRWQVWLPANWQQLGACETGYGRKPGNWRHANSRYVSAFGIQRGAFPGGYDHDARMAGMPPWNDLRPPTPWQQYRTALMHHRLYGDGWGCPGP